MEISTLGILVGKIIKTNTLVSNAARNIGWRIPLMLLDKSRRFSLPTDLVAAAAVWLPSFSATRELLPRQPNSWMESKLTNAP